MNCKICNNSSEKIFKTKVLLKYDVSYFKCSHCHFIQTEKPYWLKEAYESAIADLDIGLIHRNINNQVIVSDIINDLFDKNEKFLDYGGGYGMFVRLMRDAGYDYFRQDYFCTNLFAKHFDITDLNPKTKFEILTAFEVFEHLEDPLIEVKKMVELSDNILFSTEIQPTNNPTPENWWYFVPETGQHISLYSTKSLQILAEEFGMYYQGHAGYLHLFTKSRKKFNFKGNLKKRLLNKIINEAKPKTISLLKSDFEFVKNKLRN